MRESSITFFASSTSIWLGRLAVLIAMSIYAGNFVASRFSIHQTSLSAYDLVALRFSVAGILLLPILFHLGIKNLGGMGWQRGMILTCVAGAPYMMLMLSGLHFAPASHGAVLNPGFVPIVATVGMWITANVRISPTRVIALGVIVVGLVLVTSFSLSHEPRLLWGDTLLLLSGLSWGVFTVLVRVWRLNPLHVAVVVSVLSLAYVPPYLLFISHGIATAPASHVVFQAINQGVFNAIVALYLFAFGVRTLGPHNAALFSPLVPILATLFAIPLLGEQPSFIQWIGIILVVLGMFSAARQPLT